MVGRDPGGNFETIAARVSISSSASVCEIRPRCGRDAAGMRPTKKPRGKKSVVDLGIRGISCAAARLALRLDGRVHVDGEVATRP